ncbi:hypothetical protein ACRALDRAFT_213150 [Sodiomyces alcalophilus JCM 7366]|uniref:uncharacterized protein n=1 Tax=Sodiomyces alcalophilus JCM 7366 TaxID=591952 RepID=UPI0039B4DC19
MYTTTTADITNRQGHQVMLSKLSEHQYHLPSSLSRASTTVPPTWSLSWVEL